MLFTLPMALNSGGLLGLKMNKAYQISGATFYITQLKYLVSLFSFIRFMEKRVETSCAATNPGN